MHKIWSYKRMCLFCDSCDFIFDQKWNNLSLSDAVSYLSLFIAGEFTI